MPLEDKIPIQQVKERLTYLQIYLPGQIEEVYEFGIFLAGRFRKSGLSPIDFLANSYLAIEDLEFGRHYATKEPINSPLAHIPRVLGDFLRNKFYDIACVVCSPEFAEETKRLNKEIQKKSEEEHEREVTKSVEDITNALKQMRELDNNSLSPK
jgi:hypothetical protein